MSEVTPMDFQLFSDHVHTAHIPHRSRTVSRLPATIVNADSQRSWYERRENVIKRYLSALNCEETIVIDGVLVQRSDAYTRLTFYVNNAVTTKGTLIRYPLKQAVSAVLAAATETESEAAE